MREDDLLRLAEAVAERVAAFGASPAVAAIVAALLPKIVIRLAAAEICDAWAKSLGAEPQKVTP